MLRQNSISLGKESKDMYNEKLSTDEWVWVKEDSSTINYLYLITKKSFN